MSYCVNCGVELDASAASCPLCHTPVYHPGRPIDPHAPKPFPTQPSVVQPASKRAVSLLITAMLASMAAACGLLNLFLRPDRAWSLYVIGAAAMLWIWIVPPLLLRKMPLCLKLLLDVCAIAFYLYLIAVDLHGSGKVLASGPAHRLLGRRHSPAVGPHTPEGPVGPHHCHPDHRRDRRLSAGGGDFGGPVFAGRLDTGVVCGGPHHLRGPDYPADCSTAGPLPAGGGPAAVPYVSMWDTAGIE